MTKQLIVLFVCLLALPRSLVAQDTTAPSNVEPIKLSDLKTPAAPAFQLLGIAPTDVERPTTPRAFAVSLLSALTQSDSVLPNGFSMDVAPYWLVPHNQLEFATYINPLLAQSLRQTFSISVATSKAQSPAVDATTGLLDIGIGVRASPRAGRASGEVEKLRTAIFVSLAQASVVDALLAQIDTPMGTVPPAIATTIEQLRSGSHPGLSNAQFTAILDRITGALREALGASGSDAQVRTALLQLRTAGDASRKKAALQLQNANQKRLGFTLDVAAAMVTRTTDAQGTDTRVTREGVWTTTGYTSDALSLLGLLRYVGNSEDPASKSHLFDAGIRVIGMLGDLTASFEAIRRSDFSSVRVSDSASKAVITLEYKVSEDVTITSSFGKDFGDTRLGHDGTTVSLLGVNFGLGSRPLLPVTGRKQ